MRGVLPRVRRSSLERGKTGPSTMQHQIEAEFTELTPELGEAAVGIRVWMKSAESRLGPPMTSRYSACRRA